MNADEPRPYLSFEMAHEIREFPVMQVVVTKAAVDDYVSITGEPREKYADFVPPGFAGIFGRQSYLQDHRMPPGGVLLQQDIEWHRPVPVGEELELQATLSDSLDEGGRRSLTFDTVVKHAGDPAATIRIKVGWPL